MPEPITIYGAPRLEEQAGRTMLVNGVLIIDNRTLAEMEHDIKADRNRALREEIQLLLKKNDKKPKKVR